MSYSLLPLVVVLGFACGCPAASLIESHLKLRRSNARFSSLSRSIIVRYRRSMEHVEGPARDDVIVALNARQHKWTPKDCRLERTLMRGVAQRYSSSLSASLRHTGERTQYTVRVASVLPRACVHADAFATLPCRGPREHVHHDCRYFCREDDPPPVRRFYSVGGVCQQGAVRHVYCRL